MVLLLDCTIRDGGYINNWTFSDKCVKNCYNNLSQTGFDYIELGFCNKYNENYGKWNHLHDLNLIDTILDKQSKISVMVDFKNADIRLFEDEKNPIVDLVRVAFHKKDLKEALLMCEKLKNKGYEVSANAMNTPDYSHKELWILCSKINEFNIDYLYISDTYGYLIPDTLETLYYFIRTNTSNMCKIGLHTHNNYCNAFCNALKALKIGIDIIDSTVLGMGRGAGNLCSVSLISYLIKSGNLKYDLCPILNFAQQHIQPLIQESKWGYQLDYLISAHFETHPNYISKLKEYNITNLIDIYNIIQRVSREKKRYNQQVLDRIIAKISHFELCIL